MKKSFSCTQCDYKATRTHIKSVHEGQTFACTQCDYRAKWKSYLTRHIKSKHGQLDEEYFEAEIKVENIGDGTRLASSRNNVNPNIKQEYFEEENVKEEVKQEDEQEFLLSKEVGPNLKQEYFEEEFVKDEVKQEF